MFRKSRKVWKVLMRRPIAISLYITNRCNSRCPICGIWRAHPKIDLSLYLIQQLLSDNLINSEVIFGISGGEPLCHPKYREIFALFSNRKWHLLSNGILSYQLIDVIHEFKPERLCLSLDGTLETYKVVRGIDAYDKNLEVIKNVREEVA